MRERNLLAFAIGVVTFGVVATARAFIAPRSRFKVRSFGVPFAEARGRAWPVEGQARLVSYTGADGVVHGNAATAFHASREGGLRHHAGVDLPCAPGDPIVAMEAGRVLGSVPGFVKLDAVVVEHSACVAVYAEVKLGSLAAAGLKAGDHVRAGQVIARGALNYEGRSMLHLETWERGHAPPGFVPWMSSAPTPPTGLLDPTIYLLSLAG